MRWFVLALASCQTWSVEPMMTPSGQDGSFIRCRDTYDCYGLAAQICPSGYDIVDSTSEARGAVVVGNTVAAVNRHEMLITCRARRR